MVRAIALSIALLVGVGTLIPLATEYAEAGTKKTRKYKKKKVRTWRGVKPYSKRWWQLYRAQERRKKARREAIARRQRSLRLRQLRLARARQAAEARERVIAAAPAPKAPVAKRSVVMPSGESAPKSWQADSANPSEVRFKVDNGRGGDAGSAAITVVGPAMGETVTSGRNRTVGGVATTSLRREVINQMIRENGWVVNDYQKEIGGKPVYVVVAQSQAPGGRVQSRMFYFTESNGRIYSVATNSSAETAEKVAEETEKVIRSLQSPGRVQQASRD
ncbi:hypothetical protein [Leptolyngbya sp. 7M]|uniref:hypothetical protein n=1 Tax=Leptolyngbya sp. 7M TaxID=2812896 RepID=UPI001B8B753E|nr:hypothetical protein [Leptolyngbya sp. 7M]QYO68132.1 hypothetical protein JVX88_16010 [Leptolyngbya sp. 7M]